MTLEDALLTLHSAGVIGSPVRPGMLVHRVEVGQVYPRRISTEIGLVGVVQEEDPATTGCLAAIGRELLGDPRAYANPSLWGDWVIMSSKVKRSISGATEALAWVSLIVGRAEILKTVS